jgi:multidrug transporter EmrE-like cation transporter
MGHLCRDSVAYPFVLIRKSVLVLREESKPACVEHPPSKISVGFYATGHFACSSCLLVLTKWTLLNFTHAFPLAVLQLSFVSCAIFLMKLVGVIELDVIGFSVIKEHLPASAMFLLMVCASNSILVLSDLNTLIVVLCTAPLLHSLMDIVVQMLVSCTTAPMRNAFSLRCWWRSCLALLTLSIGVSMFVASNSSAVAAGSSWIIIYYVSSLVHRILNKNVLDVFQLSPWSNVFFSKSLALLAVPLAVFCAGEWDDVFRARTYTDIFCVDAMRPLSICLLVGVGAIVFEMNVRNVPILSTAALLYAAFCKVCAVSLGLIFFSDFFTIAGVLSIFLIILSVVGWEVSRQDRACSGTTTDNFNHHDGAQADEDVEAPKQVFSSELSLMTENIR